MHTVQKSLEQLRRELRQMEARSDRCETDGEYEACRQVIIFLRAEIERIEHNAWRAA